MNYLLTFLRKIILKNTIIFLLLLLIFCSVSQSLTQTNKQFNSGIVFGPKGAFKIDAPKNWILDNKSGLSQGLNCVLYLDGFSWNNSPVIMYSKIASTKFEDIDVFIDYSVKAFIKEDSNFIYKNIKTGEIGNKKYRILDYIGGPFISYERVFYIQMENAVGYVVFSAQNENDFKKYSDAIFEVVVTYKYKPEYIDYKE